MIFELTTLLPHLISNNLQSIISSLMTKMVLHRTIAERQPMQFISVMCTIASAYYVGKLVLQDVFSSAGKKKSN